MNTKRPFFVVFEGLDGTGKTTCASATAELLGANFMTTPSPRVREYRNALLEAFVGSQEAHQLFYLSTVFAASREVEKQLSNAQPVVLDRYFLSTQAYAEFRGSALALDGLGAHLLPADLTVFLTAPLGVRRARLSTRGSTAADLETLDRQADETLHELHRRRQALRVVGRFVELDTSTLSPDEIAQQVLIELRSL